MCFACRDFLVLGLDAETLQDFRVAAHLALEDCEIGRAILADPVVAFIETPFHSFIDVGLWHSAQSKMS